VKQLAASSRRGRGVELTPEAVDIALVALRAYIDRLVSPPGAEAIVRYQIEVFDNLDLPQEIIATTVDERLARATLAKAKKSFPGQNIVLRGKTNAGKRISPIEAPAKH
jgi:hypothetical protein